MRFVCLVLASLFCCLACTKNNNKIEFSNGKLIISDGENPASSVVGYKTCLQTDYEGDHVSICLDSVLGDSRCPKDVVCVWQGTAIAKFLFTVNQKQQELTLSTFKLPGFPSDTVLMGYKIKFLDLLPYPDTHQILSPSDYKAEVRVTKQ